MGPPLRRRVHHLAAKAPAILSKVGASGQGILRERHGVGCHQSGLYADRHSRSYSSLTLLLVPL